MLPTAVESLAFSPSLWGPLCLRSLHRRRPHCPGPARPGVSRQPWCWRKRSTLNCGLSYRPIANGAPPAARTDDEAFLRRASQDLIGELPTPAEITAFALDPATGQTRSRRRATAGRSALRRNWARYFRDMILFRRTDDRSLITRHSVTKFLTEQLNQGAGWDAIAKAFITATGDVRENGNTALIMAQMGQAVGHCRRDARASSWASRFSAPSATTIRPIVGSASNSTSWRPSSRA